MSTDFLSKFNIVASDILPKQYVQQQKMGFFVFFPHLIRASIFFCVMIGFNKLIFVIKNVHHGHLSLHVNFQCKQNEIQLLSTDFLSKFNIVASDILPKQYVQQQKMGFFVFSPHLIRASIFFCLNSGFNKLILVTKYVHHGHLSLHVNFQCDQKKNSTMKFT